MDAIEVLKVLARRWSIVVPVLILGVVGAFMVARAIPADYSATGTVLVAAKGDAGQVTAPILAEAAQDGATRTVVREAAEGSYTVEAAGDDILRVVARSSTRDGAVAVTNAVLDQLSVVLEQRAPGAGAVEVLNRPVTAELPDPEVAVYQAVGSARLTGVGDSPFSSERAARLLAQMLSRDAVRQAIGTAGGAVSYEVATSRDMPTLAVTATGTDEALVLETVNKVVAAADGQLAELFAAAGQQAPPIAATALTIPLEADVDTRGPLRSLVALLALTAAVAVAVAYVTEAVAQRRVSRLGTQRATARREPWQERDDEEPSTRDRTPDADESSRPHELVGQSPGGDGSGRG